jgi:hypothetical protein
LAISAAIGVSRREGKLKSLFAVIHGRATSSGKFRPEATLLCLRRGLSAGYYVRGRLQIL